MDWALFPPSILALGKGLGLILSVAFGSVNTVKYGVRAYNHFDGSTDVTPVFFQQESTAVQFGHDLGSCPTCLSVETDDRSYGPSLDLGRLFLDSSQSSGSAVPETITFTDVHTPISTGASTTSHARNDKSLAAPATNASDVQPESLRLRTAVFETISVWVLSGLSFFMFPVQKLLFYATDAQTPDITLSLFWQLTCLFACRLACATFSRAAVAFLYSLLQRYRVRHARAKTQPGAGTDTAENVLLRKLTAIVNACHEDPAPMTSAIHNFLVEYVDGEKARREEWLAKMKRFLNGRYNDKITGHNARQTARLEELNLQASQDIKRKVDEIEARYQRDIAGALESMKRGTRRDVGGNEEPRQSTVEGTDAINDANEPTHHDALPTDDETISGEIGKKGKSGIKNASEQHHHDTPHTDDETLSGEIGKRGKSGIKDASEPTQQTKYQPPTLRLLEVEATEIQPMKMTTGTEKEIENVSKEVSVTTTSDAAQAPPADLLHPTLDEVSIVVRNFLLSLPTKGASEDDDPGAAQSKDEDPEEGELEGKTSTGGTSGEADSKDLSPEDNGVEGEMAIKDADGEDDTCAPQGEDVDPENNEVEGKTGAQEGILSPHHNRGTKLMFSPEDLAMLNSPPIITHNKTQDKVIARHLQEGFDLQANKRLSFLEQRIIHLEMGYGTPEDPDAEPSSSLAESASLTEELSDAEIARLLWEEELAQWRHARILYYKAEAEILRARIHGQGPDSISKSNKRAIKRKQLTDRLRCVAGSSSNTISDEDDMNNEESDAEADP